MSVLQFVRNVFHLGVKELLSLRRDTVMVVLVVFSFTYGVYAPAKSSRMEMVSGSVGLVDEDRSPLSARLRDSLRAPEFLTPGDLAPSEIDEAMDHGRYTFVIDIPPEFEKDLIRGRRPTIQVIVDATVMTQAGNGVNYIGNIIALELARFTPSAKKAPRPLVQLVLRRKFNPNGDSSWFAAINHLVGSFTMLGLLLAGAALVREREHGTIEHLLVLPLRPVEVLLAKLWSTGVVVVVPATLCLELVIRRMLAVPIVGSVPLFVLGAALYMFAISALGVLLATIARSMPQFGLLFIPVHDVLQLLSGGTTPLESMPLWLQTVMVISPTTHFVSFAQAILYRGADIEVVWRDLIAMGLIGIACFLLALARFRKTMAVG